MVLWVEVHLKYCVHSNRTVQHMCLVDRCSVSQALNHAFFSQDPGAVSMIPLDTLKTMVQYSVHYQFQYQALRLMVIY